MSKSKQQFIGKSQLLMNQVSQFDLNVDQVSKLNKLLPKGYKLITVQDHQKKIAHIQRKPKTDYVPIPRSTLQQNVTARRVKNVSYNQGLKPERSKIETSYEKRKKQYIQKQLASEIEQSQNLYTPSVLKQIKQPSMLYKQQIPPPIQQAPSLLLKKKLGKTDFKNLTIMQKRILGQNIKKLPNQCLPQICRIVFETLQTREEYVIDIDTLPIKKVKELQLYVNTCINRFGNFDEGNEIKNQADSSESSFMIDNDFE